MPYEPAGGDDDWVKQMLAEAMLGGTRAISGGLAGADEPVVVDESMVVEPVVVDEPVVDQPPVFELPQDDAPAPEPVAEQHLVLEQTAALERQVHAIDHASSGVVLDLDRAPASANRLFERPIFDATRDPGVDEMVTVPSVSRSEVATPVEDPSPWRGALEWVVVLGSAVIVALVLRAFLFQAFFIPSESMEDTLLVDDRVLVNKLSYRFGDVQRGEVVVFRRPENQPGEFRDLIKRVIGLPGETIEARDNTIFIDGQVLIEPYLSPGEVIGDFGPVLVPEGEYFMMGDNRNNSGDSRVFGPVSEDLLIGRAFFLFWPLDRIGSL